VNFKKCGTIMVKLPIQLFVIITKQIRILGDFHKVVNTLLRIYSLEKKYPEEVNPFTNFIQSTARATRRIFRTTLEDNSLNSEL
jgi:hypothetical protein